MAKENEKKNKEMTVSEAGHKGGEKVSQKYGHEHFEEIGKMGGHKGGEIVSEKYPHEHFEEIGHKGGEKVSEKYGHEHFEEIGHKGGQKVRDLIEKGKESEGR
ncbi:MAG: hypothetical protein M0Z94_01350 [Dehalococcoidales bacterium]|nr:hypothetical protein [Dehalococcoidales bacterium]